MVLNPKPDRKIISRISSEISRTNTSIAKFIQRKSILPTYLSNEYISKACNFEDKVKGHFWEARFKSQALLDEKAVNSNGNPDTRTIVPLFIFTEHLKNTP